MDVAQFDSLSAAVHALNGSAGKTSEPQGAERRQAERHPYECIQRIAACEGETVPDAAEFHEVQCHDISTSGISFFYPTEPNFNRVVIELGTPPIFVFAAVIYMMSVPDREGYLVGCEFAGRVS